MPFFPPQGRLVLPCPPTIAECNISVRELGTMTYIVSLKPVGQSQSPACHRRHVTLVAPSLKTSHYAVMAVLPQRLGD